MIAATWHAVPWMLVTAAAVLAVPATVMGDRGLRGVRGVKTAVTALLSAAVVVRVFLRSAAATTAGAAAATAGAVATPAPAAFFYLILIGIVFTVIADWLLAPPENERNFPAGLAAFLIGYLLYGIALLLRVATIGRYAIAGDNGAGGGLSGTTAAGEIAAGAGLGVAVGVIAIVYIVVAAASVAQFRSLQKVPPNLRLAVIIYVAIAANLLAAGILNAIVGGYPVVGGSGFVEAVTIGAGVVSGTPPGGGWALAGSVIRVLLPLGTAMIYISDSLIAHNLFRKPLRRPELLIMPTYYVGQVAIVAALLLM